MKQRLFLFKILILLIIFNIIFIACDNENGLSNNEKNNNGIKGVLAVNNLPSGANYAVGVYNHSEVINDLMEWTSIASQIIAVGADKASNSITLYTANTSNVFDQSGVFMVALFTSDFPISVFYKTGVNFNNGNAEIDYNTMVDFSGNNPCEVNSSGKLIINNFPLETSLAITVYDYDKEVICLMDITSLQAETLTKTLATSLGLAASSPVNLQSFSTASINTFNKTGIYLVLLTKLGTLEVFYADMVSFNNGNAELDFDMLGLISDLPLMPGGTGEPISNIDYISDYLAKQKGGTEPDRAINLVIESIPLSADNWSAILDAINTADKFVNLDLFGCTASDNGGCLNTDGTFDPLSTVQTGKNKIISIILPYAAAAIIQSYFPAFQYFNNLRSVNAVNVSDIGGGAFAGLGNLSSVNFPNIAAIGSEAFARCVNLSSITIPASILLADNPFYGCVSLSSFILTDIGDLSAMEGGKILVRNNTELVAYPSAKGNITITNVIIKIGNSAFAGCSGLINIIMPNSIEIIGDNAFSGNMSYGVEMNLTVIEIPNNVISIGSGAFARNKIISLVIPNNVAFLGSSAFWDNPLTSLTISNQITEINNHTFYGCKLTSLIIPNNVKSIGYWAFYPSFETLVDITIGENVSLGTTYETSLPNEFVDAYNTTYEKTAGTYTRSNISSTIWIKK